MQSSRGRSGIRGCFLTLLCLCAVPVPGGCVPDFEPVSDLAPLEVVGTTPFDGETGVPLEAVVRVTFSKPLLPSSVTPQSLRVEALGGDPVSGELSLSEDLMEVTFTPSVDWFEGVFYQVVVTRGLQDEEGQPLWLEGVDRAQIVHFRAFASIPYVVSISPEDGAFGVSSSLDRVSVVFSEPMDPESLHAGSFFLYDVQGDVFYDAAELRADFVLHEPLVPHRTYRGLVTTTVCDEAGLPLDAPVPFSFHVLPDAGEDSDFSDEEDAA